MEDLRCLPQEYGAPRDQLNKLQENEPPDDWKPMPGIGPGAAEIRIRDSSGAYRVIYVAKFARSVYVLHVFKKQRQKTAVHDIELARTRYRELLRSGP